MAQKKFLVTGATGDTGGYTVELLWRRLLGVPEAASVRVWQLMSR